MASHSSQRAILPLLLAFFFFLQAATAAKAFEKVERTPEAMNAHLDETTKLLHERADNIAIVGVPGTVAPRLEIREMAKNRDQWNLYLLGMKRFQEKDHRDRLSYYQVAGVHGVPFVTWNNFGPLLNNAGFCPHAQHLFGSWHRPYLAIFEQALYQSVEEVINDFPGDQQQRWRNAAATLRMPYWDWAQAPPNGQSTVPSLIRDEQVELETPRGRERVNNPLFSYRWGDRLDQEIGAGPWDNSPVTLRRPVANPTRSNNDEFAGVMDQLRVNLRDRVYGLFMSGASWGQVSTSALGVATQQNGGNPDSFESVHDAVHVAAGGESGGHMWFLDYSSFDPVFWLHHTNIDRLLALYQVVQPNSWVAAGNINRPMAQWNQGEPKNSYSPLKPFTKNTNGDFYTSEEVRRTTRFGYVYPETANNANRESVNREVERLYGSRSNRRRAIGGTYEGRPFQDGDYHTVLQVISNKYALDGSYTVHCYIGAGNNSTANSSTPARPTGSAPAPKPSGTGSSTPGSGSDYTKQPGYVGSYGILGASKAGGEVKTEGCIPLTTALQGKQLSGDLKDLNPKEIETYLKQHLSFKVVGTGGKEMPAASIPGLNFQVKAAKVNPPKNEGELPSLEKFETIPKATENLPCGTPYVPSPAEISPPVPANVSLNKPELEQGYCKISQTVVYVDEGGNFLYKEM